MSWKFPLYEVGAEIEWDRLEDRFDWIQEMRDVPQDPLWHAEGDVFIHTQMVTEALVNLPEYQGLSEQDQHVLFAAALLHDVEKRSTTTTMEIDGVERIVSPSHPRKGEFTARELLYREIPTPFKVREQIAKLVRYHGLPPWAIQKKDARKEVITASLAVNTEFLYLLAKADVLGRISADGEEVLLRVELFKELCQEHECWGKARAFPSDYARYWYLNKEESSPDYDPFDDLKCEVTMMCALPGSGKDTYIQRNLNVPILSLDEIRRAHKIDPRDKKKNGQVIQMGKEQAKVFLRKQTSFVFNATNITREMRSKWISLFTEYGARVRIVYLEVPHSQLITQNHNRAHKVPENILDKMIRKWEMPGYAEAHEVVFEVGDKVL